MAESSEVSWDKLKNDVIKSINLNQTEGFLHMEDFNNAKIYYREVCPESELTGSLLFLHGASFKSDTWLDLGSLHYMASQGYRSVAIDLPGYGKSTRLNVSPSSLLVSVMNKLHMERTILVSPSMSGSFSIPLLKEHPEVIRGYVPVAPTNTEEIPEEGWQSVEVPSLVIYGERDRERRALTLKALKRLPNKEVVELAGAGHAAYMNKPGEFHRALLDFCNNIHD